MYIILYKGLLLVSFMDLTTVCHFKSSCVICQCLSISACKQTFPPRPCCLVDANICMVLWRPPPAAKELTCRGISNRTSKYFIWCVILKTGLQPIVWGRSRFTYQFCYGPFYMPFALHNWYYLINKCCYITTQALDSAFFLEGGGGGVWTCNSQL